MGSPKFVSRWILIVGIIIVIIGIIHDSFSPMAYNQIAKDEMYKDKAAGFAYFFALAGVSFIFAGLLMAYASSGLKRSEKWAWHIAISANIFTVVAGICGITLAKFDNPLIYIMSAGAFSNLVFLFSSSGNFTIAK